MSESTSEDFSDSDSDVVEEQKETNGKEKAPVKRKKAQDFSDSEESDSDFESNDGGDKSDEDSKDEEHEEPQPVKKRKTLKDYMNEKVRKNISAIILSLTSTGAHF
jgi:DNA-directed RNA polymerase specialized sigma54-like protein